MTKGGKRTGAGRPPTGEKKTFLLVIKPESFNNLKGKYEAEKNKHLLDSEVVDIFRQKCYDLLQSETNKPG